MRILTLFRACLLVLPLLVLWPFSADAAESSWSFQTAAATQKAPTVTLARNGLPEPAVKTCYCCEVEECQCGPGCQCIRVKGKSAPEKKPAKIAWDWSKGEVKVFDDQEAAQKWKDATVQAPVYAVPYQVYDSGNLPPPPPDVIGPAIITTVPLPRMQVSYAAPIVAYYQPTYAQSYAPSYQSYYYPPQQNTAYSYSQGGLFGQRRSYSYQQSYRPASVGVCGPGGCTPGG